VAHELGVKPENCVVFEDAEAGITAANRAGMYAVGIGDQDRLPGADVVYPNLAGLTLERIKNDLEAARAY
jgi:beta-phosphoglucomutase-like phosphatase (HAD superfamily)